MPTTNQNNSSILRSILFCIDYSLKTASLSASLRILTAIICGILPATSLYFIGEIAHNATSTTQPTQLIQNIVFFSSIIYISNLINSQINPLLFITLSQKLDIRIRSTIAEHSLNLPISELDNPEVHDARQLAQTTGYTGSVRFLENLLSCISSTISCASYVALLFSISPISIAILTASAIPLIWASFSSCKNRFKTHKRCSKDLRRKNYFYSLLSQKGNLAEIKHDNLGQLFLSKWTKSSQTAHRQILSARKTELVRNVPAQALSSIGLFLAILLISGEDPNGLTQGTTILVFIQGAAALHASLRMTSVSIVLMYEDTISVRSIKSFLSHHPSETEKDKKVKIDKIDSIEFRNVTFKYPKAKTNTLESLSFSAKRGERISIIGKNGSGKSTIFKLLTRQYTPQSGNIYINNIDIQQIDETNIQSQIASVFQNFNRYETSIIENITPWADFEAADYNRARSCARQTEAHDFIDRLPKSYDTELGVQFDSGTELSGGQWQKLAISRSLYKSTSLLFLDEPTASIDTISTLKFSELLNSLTRDKICILVTHDKWLTKFTDRVISLNQQQAPPPPFNPHICPKERVTHDGPKIKILGASSRLRRLSERQRGI